MTQYKQAIVLKQDTGMSRGKAIAQACHASLKAYKRAGEETREEWESQGGKKVALETGDKDIRNRFQRAKDQGIPAYLVEDAGLTELEPGTITALGVGPASESKIDSITGDLKLIE
ncbi:MAG: peptidyl-tRNA hydrolase Pth2 [Candidatus Nanohaloarchaea archaeon]